MRRNIQYYTLYISDNRMNRLEAYMQRMIRATNTRPAKNVLNKQLKVQQQSIRQQKLQKEAPFDDVGNENKHP